MKKLNNLDQKTLAYLRKKRLIPNECKKKGYPDKEAAIRALNALKTNTGITRKEEFYYYCKLCRQYHLTSGTAKTTLRKYIKERSL